MLTVVGTRGYTDLYGVCVCVCVCDTGCVQDAAVLSKYCSKLTGIQEARVSSMVRVSTALLHTKP